MDDTPTTVDAYLALQTPPARAALEQVRALLHQELPDAEEVISYAIAALRWRGKVALYFAGYARHVAIYPVTAGIQADLGDALTPHLSGKATLRFPLSKPLPEDLIVRVAASRRRELSA